MISETVLARSLISAAAQGGGVSLGIAWESARVCARSSRRCRSVPREDMIQGALQLATLSSGSGNTSFLRGAP